MPLRIADLPTGAKVKFGAYQVSDEEPHKICWVKVHHDNTFLSEFLEDQCAFDAKEPEHENEYRRAYGNNRYSVSNVNQFINSEEPDWFSPTTPTDTPPINDYLYDRKNGYRHKPGFLHLFAPWELEAIDLSCVKTALPKMDITRVEEKSEEINARVFLPSKFNLTGEKENGVEEGEFWDYFKNGASIECPLSPECFAFGECDEKPDEEEDGWYYNLRSPCAGYAYGVRFVGRCGGVFNCDAYDGFMGLRPALKINPEILISDEPDCDGYYEVLETAMEAIEIPEDEFIALLKI